MSSLSSSTSSATAPVPASAAATTSAAAVAATPAPLKADLDAEIESFLYEESQLEKEQEVDRILSAFKLNPFDVLGIRSDANKEEILKHFRTLSLRVHPDKLRADLRDKAQTAFARLAQAKADVLDEEKHEKLLEVVSLARQTVITRREKAHKQKLREEEAKRRNSAAAATATTFILSTSSTSTSTGAEGEYDATRDADFELDVRKEVRELLIEQEWKRRQLLKLASQHEGSAEAEKERKRKEREEKEAAEKAFEESRGARVNSWRSFQKGAGSTKLKSKVPKASKEVSSSSTSSSNSSSAEQQAKRMRL